MWATSCSTSSGSGSDCASGTSECGDDGAVPVDAVSQHDGSGAGDGTSPGDATGADGPAVDGAVLDTSIADVASDVDSSVVEDVFSPDTSIAPEGGDGSGSDGSVGDEAQSGGEGGGNGDGGLSSDASDEPSPPPVVCTTFPGPPCATGTKSCWTGCVSIDQPQTSCGVPGTCTPCQLAHATATCSVGACAIGSCETGYADCNHVASDGCEVDVTTNTNCGACQVACGTGQVCDQGSCTTAACSFPETDCTGTCANLQTSLTHCGGCGTVCSSGSDLNAQATCSGGVCGTAANCRGGLTYCSNSAGTRCADTMDDPSACGSSCTVCPGGNFASCAAGACAISCPVGWMQCGSTCTNASISVQDCGACGHACATGEWCNAGTCMPAAIANGLSDPMSPAVNGATVAFLSGADDSVRAIPHMGGAVTVLATNQAKPMSLQLDDQYAYWASNLGGAIVRDLTNGQGTPISISSAVQPTNLVLNSGNAYFIDQNGLSYVPVAGGQPVVLVKLCSGITCTGNVAGGVFSLFSTNSYIITQLSPTICCGGNSLGWWSGQTSGGLPEGFGWSPLAAFGTQVLIERNPGPPNIGFAWYDMPTDTLSAFGDTPLAKSSPQSVLGGVWSAVAVGCGAYVAASSPDLGPSIWWVPLRSFASNVELPTVIPVLVGVGTLSVVSDGQALYVTDTGPAGDGGGGVQPNSGAIYRLGLQ